MITRRASYCAFAGKFFPFQRLLNHEDIQTVRRTIDTFHATNCQYYFHGVDDHITDRNGNSINFSYNSELWEEQIDYCERCSIKRRHDME
jgi:hypothetical protein